MNGPAPEEGDGRAGRVAQRLLGAIAALCLFAMMALTFASVIARYFLNRPIAGDAELQGFFLGFIIFAGLPLVTRAQRHIAVHSFAALLKGRARTVQRVFVFGVTAAGFAFIAYLLALQGQSLGADATRTSFLEIPEAPFAYLFAVFALVAALFAAARLRRLAARQPERFETGEPVASFDR